MQYLLIAAATVTFIWLVIVQVNKNDDVPQKNYPKAHK